MREEPAERGVLQHGLLVDPVVADETRAAAVDALDDVGGDGVGSERAAESEDEGEGEGLERREEGEDVAGGGGGEEHGAVRWCKFGGMEGMGNGRYPKEMKSTLCRGCLSRKERMVSSWTRVSLSHPRGAIWMPTA